MDALPTQFVYEYTPDVQIVLHSDTCPDGLGWRAQAVDNASSNTASGCWVHGKNNTVVLFLEDDNHKGVYFDFTFVKDFFKPIYGQ